MWGHARNKKRVRSGFALPTILIASTVMLIVMGSVLVSVSASTLVNLEARHYSTYAKNAAQSGMVMAQACLKANNYEPQWTNANPLRPNTNCSGVVQSGASQYIHDASDVRSTFSVPLPTALANGVQRVTVSATSNRLTTSTGAVWRSYSESSSATISAQATFNKVAFGYDGLNGAFFGVISPEGAVSAVGYNGSGQLGNGTASNTSTPTTFALPAGLQASQLFTNFLSIGKTMMAVTTNGELYGAGANESGQLGNGTTAATQRTPVRFTLPAGVSAVYVATGDTYTFVIGSDNNVYSVGSCNRGILGNNYTISGCSNRSTAQRVALPAVNTSNPATLPVTTSGWTQSTNLAVDRYNAYVRMQGGELYGWGANEYGQLGDGTNTDQSSPRRFGNFGDAGQPDVTQVAFDGMSVWALDSNGDVWASGINLQGQLGTSVFLRTSHWRCVDNPNNSESAQQLRTYDCNGSTAQQLHFDTDGSIKFHPTASTTLCLDNYGFTQANGNPVYAYPCNGASNQKWEYLSTGQIRLLGSSYCLDNPGNSTGNVALSIHTCVVDPAQTWTPVHVSNPMRVWLPPGQGKVQRITTDQDSTLFLMTNGTVWGYGRNGRGQLGTAAGELVSEINPMPRRFVFPAGRTAIDLYTTATGTGSTSTNTYVVLDDGSVWGSGTNNYGQLGNGTTSAYVVTPVRMNLPAGVIARSVQSGLGTTVVLTNEGRIYTVGNNSNGQLGDGTTTNSSTPTARQYVNTRPVVLY